MGTFEHSFGVPESTNTDRYLDFCSHHPLAHKVVVACTLFNCAEKICSDFLDTEKKDHVAKALQSNGYPRELVMKNWRPSVRSRLPEQDTLTATVTLPYNCLLLETIRRTLAPFRIRTCFQPHCTQWQMLVRLKD